MTTLLVRNCNIEPSWL